MLNRTIDNPPLKMRRSATVLEIPIVEHSYLLESTLEPADMIRRITPETVKTF